MNALPSAHARHWGCKTNLLAVCGGSNSRQDGREVFANGLVGEAQDLEPGRDQERFSLGVVFSLCKVDCSVKLDGEAVL